MSSSTTRSCNRTSFSWKHWQTLQVDKSDLAQQSCNIELFTYLIIIRMTQTLDSASRVATSSRHRRRDASNPLQKNVQVTRSNVTHSGIAHSTITKHKQVDWDQWCFCIQITHQAAPQINSASRGKKIQNMLAFRTLTNSDHRILQKVRFFGKTNRLENSRKHFDKSRKRQTSPNLKLTIRKIYSKKCVQRMKRIAEDWASLPSAMQQSPTVHNPNILLLPSESQFRVRNTKWMLCLIHLVNDTTPSFPMPLWILSAPPVYSTMCLYLGFLVF